jgi:hydroxymethylbilane synthase
MKIITVGGRKSPLSQAQIDEVFLEIKKHYDDIIFEKTVVESTGDLDLKTSLKTIGKTDFFTKEIDDLLFARKCRIAIHSAKDLPEIINPALHIIAITKGLDPSDSLVLQEGMSITTLRNGAVIAASSTKREEAVKLLRPDLTFQDVRGQIQARLDLLNSGKVDGVVIAEAALIRLKLTHLNRIPLRSITTPLQGQLAILAHVDDSEMKELFACLDTKGS